MKKLFAQILSLTLVLSLVACDKQDIPNNGDAFETSTANATLFAQSKRPLYFA